MLFPPWGAFLRGFSHLCGLEAGQQEPRGAHGAGLAPWEPHNAAGLHPHLMGTGRGAMGNRVPSRLRGLVGLSTIRGVAGGLLGGWGLCGGVDMVVGLPDLCSPPGAAGALWDGQGVLQAALGPVLLLGVLAASGAQAGGLQARRAGGAPGLLVGAGGRALAH